MKKISLLLLLLTLLSFSYSQFNESLLDQFIFSDIPYSEIVESIDSTIASQQPSYSQGSNGYNILLNSSLLKKYGRWQHFWKTRVDDEGSAKKLNQELYNYYNNLDGLCNSSRTSFVNWEGMGPFNSDGSGGYSSSSGVVYDVFVPNDKHNQGRIESFAVNPFDENDILIGTKNGGYFSSQNDGLTWHNTTNDEYISMFGARDLEYHPGVVDLVLASTGKEIFRSTTHIKN